MESRHQLAHFGSSECILEAEIDVIESAIGGESSILLIVNMLTSIRRRRCSDTPHVQEFFLLHPHDVWLLQGQLHEYLDSSQLSLEI